MVSDPISVRVPATTANLGPGFDCMGMALDVWNDLLVQNANRLEVSVQGQGASELPEDADNLVYRAMKHLFGHAHVDIPPIKLRCHNQIPLQRGLGSSAAAIVGGLVAADVLMSQILGAEAPVYKKEDILEQAVRLEGHPDNVTAALLGGLQLVVDEEGVVVTAPVQLPDDIATVLFIPTMTIATGDARAVLPSSVAREDAVYNTGRVALLVNALATGRLDHLHMATRDRLHQPYRQNLFPAMKVIFQAAMKAGALGVFLSGSGPTVLALTRGREMTVAYEMADAARQANVDGETKITRPTPHGAHLMGTGE